MVLPPRDPAEEGGAAEFFGTNVLGSSDRHY
jgi:hypothetical protein